MPSKSVVKEPVKVQLNVQNKPTVRKGSTGPYVKLVQELLSLRGYILKVDGIFGPATETYVRSFQKAHGLEADGIVGPMTWNKLAN
jgi:peptidoglycan hydrolase-like protein with peptidoglycan-binding domain